MLLSTIAHSLAALTAASIIYCLVCIIAARRFFTESAVGNPPLDCPPVTILIPLCGADFKALDNYGSLCRQDYPQFQIVFGVQDPGDSSIEVVRHLMERFPEKDIALVVSEETLGENPKVSNLHNMFSQAKNEHIVIMDSDVRVGSDFLRSILAEFRNGEVGLVTCPYRAAEAPNLPSTFEAIGITGDFMPGVFVARLLEGVTFALGAAMLTTRERLLSIGGFAAFADDLADDYMLGNLINKAGHEVRLSRYVVGTMPVHSSFRAVVRHQVRWARGTRICRPLSYAGIIITHGTALGLLSMAAAGFSTPSIGLLFLALAARLTMAWTVGVSLMKDAILARNLWLLPLRDLLGFSIWCASFFGNTVEWRGKRFRLIRGGRLRPLNSA